jgi:hypothetical protein
VVAVPRRSTCGPKAAEVSMTRAFVFAALCAACTTTPKHHDDFLPSIDPELRKDRVSASSVVPCGATDRVSDGTIDLIYRFGYDSAGHLISQHTNLADGSQPEDETLTYDSGGNLIEDDDHLLDGTFGQWNTYLYDVHGRNVTWQFRQLNQGAEYKETRTNEFNDIGLRILAHVDKNADGTIDSQVTYSYDDLGREIENLKDDKLDGTIDRTTTVAYDDAAGTIDIDQTFTGYTPDHWTITYQDDRIVSDHWTMGNRGGDPTPPYDSGTITYLYTCN